MQSRPSAALGRLLILPEIARRVLGRCHREWELDARLRAHENNFDALRLLFAVLVLFSHSYALLGRSDEPFATSLGYDNGGGFAVAGFFVISGFLVTRSALSSGWRRYAAGRVLRILPGLAVVSIVSVLVVGPLTTQLSLVDYFSRSATWGYLNNALVFPVRFGLPGVFAGNPMQAVNGSLWTLPIETAMYIGLPLLVGAGLFSRVGIVVLMAAVSVVFYLGTAYWGLSWEDPGQSPIDSLPVYSLLKLGVFFVAGALLYVHRGWMPLSPALAAGVLILWAVLHHTPAGLVAWYLGLPYLVFFFGFHRASLGAFFAKHGDLSYGVYLYAFPMQQSVIYALGADLGIASLTLASLAPTLALAFWSWHIVERPVLTWKARWSGPKSAMAASFP